MRYDQSLFGPLWPYIKNEKVTDIRWNGISLWITDLDKGKYCVAEDGTPLTQEDKEKGKGVFVLNRDFIENFCAKIAISVNENFNLSEPSLKAETPDLRIQAEHESISGTGKYTISIRKTPCVSRLQGRDLVEEGYMISIVNKLIPCLMRAHCSSVVTGDVGAGKTELEKYMVSFIPDHEAIVTVEDVLEMKIQQLYPYKDCASMRITEIFSAEDAIRDSLRLQTKWLILAEARGREIARVMEGASTGCCALVSIHAEHVWEIPDRIMSMAPDGTSEGFKNDVYTFFDVAIKVGIEFINGVQRKITEVCFFDRENEENKTYVFVKDGKLNPYEIPESLLEKFRANSEIEFLIALEEERKKYDLEQEKKKRLAANGQ